MLKILIFAIIAIFFIFKLYKVLGDTKYEPPKKNVKSPPNPSGLKGGKKSNKIIDINEYKNEEETAKLKKKADEEAKKKYGKENWEKIRQIQKINPAFDPDEFIIGAQNAFEYIIKAIDEHDKEAIEELVSKELYKNIAGEIDKRIESEKSYHTTIISYQNVEIVNIEIEKKTAAIKINFVTEQISIVKDATGKIIEGDASQVDEISDYWTFEKDIGSSNPNWILTSVS